MAKDKKLSDAPEALPQDTVPVASAPASPAVEPPAASPDPALVEALKQINALKVQVADLQASQRTDSARLAKLAADEAHLKWAELSTAQKSQIEADRRFGNDAGDDYEVSHPQSGSPPVRLPAFSDFEAVGKYSQLCGILSVPPDQPIQARKVKKKAA